MNSLNDDGKIIDLDLNVIYSNPDLKVVDPGGHKSVEENVQTLEECIKQAENLSDILHNNAMAAKVVGILSRGLRLSGEMLSKAIYQLKMAKSERKQKEALAALERFTQYIAEHKEVKSTDATRAHYIAIDKDVLVAVEREAYYEALVSQLETYQTQFTMTLSAVKSMINNNRSELLSGQDIGVKSEND